MVKGKKSKIYIYDNGTALSMSTRSKFAESLKNGNFDVMYNERSRAELAAEADLISCIGGDGTLLRLLHNCDFPTAPIIGVNTGHLGFFQELTPDDIGKFIDAYNNDRYTVQNLPAIDAVITFAGGGYVQNPVTAENDVIKSAEIERRIRITALNEVMMRGILTHMAHFDVSVGDTIIQQFSGDGILVSTPAGSTAYNYSLGGSIVSPELRMMQLTPVAPASTDAYRSYRSSIILPLDKKVTLRPLDRSAEEPLFFTYDGLESSFEKVKRIEFIISSRSVNIIRFEAYNYWEKLREKLL